MRKMLVISSDQELNDRVERVCAKFNNYFTPVFHDNMDEALEFLRYELPEINVINFSDDRIPAEKIMETIKEDPWLHYGGIIGVHSRKDARRAAEQTPGSNVISLIPRGMFVNGFFRVLKILILNRQVLFQRELQTHLMHNIAGSFVMDNDPFNVRAYAGILSNYLYNSNYINREQRDRLHVAIFEMLMNAVEHGNCNISYEEKTKWLEEHGDILDLIREKNKNQAIRSKRVFISYRITQDRSHFSIRDEGAGFDWKSRIKSQTEAVNLGPHGRGIQMSTAYAENLRYNETGNEVSFEVGHQQNETNVLPGIFQDQREVVFNDGETVFQEGEVSNHLYYIVSGQLGIYSSGQYLTTLNPNDIFLGEMSFLLNNKRSATVISVGRSVLIRLSKNSFINLIKQNPHYGIFLARLIAQRLSRLNQKVAEFQEEHGAEAFMVEETQSAV